MYTVTIYNGDVETLIHHQGITDAPHIMDNTIKIVENQSSMLSFKINIDNPGYDKITDLVTTIKVVDIRNNSIIFEGRILLSTPTMNETGMFYKDVICESELGYLNDSRVGRWELHPSVLPADSPSYAEGYQTVQTSLQKIIDNHNANTDAYKHFTMGVVEINYGIYFYTKYESSLDIILTKLINDNGLTLLVRKSNGVRYLDVLLDNPRISQTEIQLRTNIKSFKRTPDHSSFCTRLIAIGAEGITFDSINGGKNYVEDAEAIKKYGIISKPHEWGDVTIPENLLTKAKAKLVDILGDTYEAVEATALDLSYIGLAPEQFKVGVKYRVTNEVQQFSDLLKVVQLNLDLSEPWNSSLVFSNIPVSATSDSIGIQQQINNNRIEVLTYNGRIIQKVSSMSGAFESYREQTDKAIIERVTNGNFESYKEQTAEFITQSVIDTNKHTDSKITQLSDTIMLEVNKKVGDTELGSKIELLPTSVQVAFNNITNNIQNGGGVFSILNGSISVKNKNNTVVIDGEHNIHKIMIEGTTTLSVTNAELLKTIEINHNLGYKPVIQCFQLGANGEDVYTSFPALTIGGTSGISIVIRSRCDSNKLYIDYLKLDSTYVFAGTITIKYFIYKEVAF